MKNGMLFGSCGGEMSAKEGDGAGELREEEIFWGESEVPHHHHKEADAAIAGAVEKPVAKMAGGRLHRAMGRQLSMLSRQMEAVEVSTWAARDRMSAALAAKKLACGGHEQEEEEGGAAQRHARKLIPPHELLAREYAVSASFSVLHGAGRTLKGMDLRRLRNEVWRQTGFVD